MIDFIVTAYSNEVVKIFFWGPVLFNAVFYPLHSWARFQNDKKAVREYLAKKENDPKGYHYLSHGRFITFGDLVTYLFFIFTPILNALATIFDSGPEAIRYLFGRFAWLFEKTLVRPVQ